MREISKVFRRVLPAEVNLEGNVGPCQVRKGKEHSGKRKYYVQILCPPRMLRGNGAETEGSIDEAAEREQGQVTENPVHWQVSRAAVR